MIQELNQLNVPIILNVLEKLSQVKDKRVRSQLRKTSRRSFQFYSEELPRMISLKALEVFQTKGVDPQTIGSFSKTKGINKDLVLEHTTPIMEFIDELLSLPVEDREDRILNYSGVCWVTKEEDKLLEKKYRTKRQGQWEKCYKECGIDFVSPI